MTWLIRLQPYPSHLVFFDDIAEKALSGEDIAQYFTNRGVMKPAVNLITVGFLTDVECFCFITSPPHRSTQTNASGTAR
jgi:hypothetical protein